MWCVLSETGELLRSFRAGADGWRKAVRWATEHGGELDIQFLAHVSGPEWESGRGEVG